MISKFEVERFSLVSKKSFAEVVSAVHTAVAHPNMAELISSIHQASSVAQMEHTIQQAVGTAGLMLFVAFDQGAVVNKGIQAEASGLVRLLVGNPLIMAGMARHVPDAGSYAPVTILIDERTDGVHLSYDRMASFLARHRSPEALKIALDLDRKIESLLQHAAS